MLIFGLSKIARKVNLDRRTILKFHKKYGFPMRKLGGRWITTNDLALQWFKENIELFTKSYNHSILIKEGIRLR